MQGFNRYIPADFDPRNTSTLNAHQGKKHALGKRAKDIDKGILIVRFELPFNIWCGTCNAHIGAGVRYNAQKKKVGNYYSTPIYGFRCKCHLCDGWFEIRTDPKNAAYVVHEGARKKDEDWDPAENGGYAIHDTDAPSASQPPADPFGHVEKTIDQQQWAKKNTSRLTELYHASTRLNADPYVVSSALRRRFREEKKVMLEKQGRDDGLKERYGLSEDVDLGDEAVERGREMWEAGRERAGLPIEPSADEDGAEEGSESVRALSGTPTPTKAGGSGSGRNAAAPDLGSLLRKTTARRYDPFASAADGLFGGAPTTMKAKPRVKEPPPVIDPPASKPEDSAPALGGLAVLAGYDSD